MRRVVVALVHHPVLDRGGAIVTSAITNIDLHDIARSSHTFGATDFFVVHPVAAQRVLAERVREHWTAGSGARRIPDRAPALSLLRIVSSLDEVVEALKPEVWVTSAVARGSVLSYSAARTTLTEPGAPVLLVFGTGWGLAGSVLDAATHQLAPIVSPRADAYNHLSVRAAVAITLDRLLAPG